MELIVGDDELERRRGDQDMRGDEEQDKGAGRACEAAAVVRVL